MSIESYPLHWPAGWPRTKPSDRKYGRFSTKRQASHSNYMRSVDVSVAEALGRIQSELDAFDGPQRYWTRIDPDQTVISTNLQTRLDGLPRSGQSKPDDPGAALYFSLDGKRQCVPCDSYTKVAQNLAAIAATLSALRTLERHGSGLMERAFTGFQALPDQSNGAWWAVLGVSPDAAPADVEAAYKRKRRETHPDREGGSHDAFVRVAEAWNRYQEQAA